MPVCPNCGKKVEEWATFCPYCGSKLLVDKDKLKSEIDRLKSKEKLGITLMILCDLTALPFIIMGQDYIFFVTIMIATGFSAISLHYNRMRAKLEEIYKKSK